MYELFKLFPHTSLSLIAILHLAMIANGENTCLAGAVIL